MVQAQTQDYIQILKGQIVDSDSELPLSEVQIIINGQPANVQLTDENGMFVIEGNWELPLEVQFSSNAYEALVIQVIDGNQGTKDMGTIYLINLSDWEDNSFALTSQELLSEDESSEGFSSLLNASRDPLVQVSSFNWGWARFRMRGLNTQYQDFTLNGIPVNNMETGNVPWNLWGGLNDAVRSRHDIINLNAGEFVFGGPAGSSQIDMRPSAQRPGTKISYLATNSNYRNRIMASYNTGIGKNGWGFSILGSKRWAEEGYVEGTNYDSYGGSIGIEKRFNKQHSISFNAFANYLNRARRTASVQEAYDLVDCNYYNPNWGYQNGKKRSARVGRQFQPTMLLNYDWNKSDNFQLHVGLMYMKGRYGTSALNWNNASDPRPDYYQYLPSYEETEVGRAAVADAWMNNSDYAAQIKWDELYQANYASSFTVENAEGIAGNTIEGSRSKYILEERRYDPTQFSFATHALWYPSDKWQINTGISLAKGMTHNYVKLLDLLGGDYYLNIDRFAERDLKSPYEDEVQVDLANPIDIAYAGDVIGYDYEIHTSEYKFWIENIWTLNKLDIHFGGQLGSMDFHRYGNYQSGLFPSNSKGASETYRTFIYDIKGGLNFKIDARNYIYANAAYGQRGPQARHGFVAPRVQNELNPYLQPWTYLSMDAGYQLRTPYVKLRIGVFQTQLKDQTTTRAFYNDLKRAFGYYMLGDLDYDLKGIEAGFEIKLNKTLNLNGGFTLGNYTLSDRPIASQIDDRSTDFIFKDETIYAKGAAVPSMPQTCAGLGLQYNSPKYWWVRLNANVFDDIFIDFNPERRRLEAIENVPYQSELYQAILTQEEIANTDPILNLSVGKSWRIQGNYLRLHLAANNLLNNKNFRTGGFEQSRFDIDTRDPDAFPPRYYYNYGTTFLGIITYQF